MLVDGEDQSKLNVDDIQIIIDKNTNLPKPSINKIRRISAAKKNYIDDDVIKRPDMSTDENEDEF